MTIEKLKVNLGSNSYNIVFSERERDFLLSFKKSVKSQSIFIITDKNVAALYLKRFSTLLESAGFICKSAVIEPGEKGKNLKSLSGLYDSALRCGIDRKSCAVALGGGVVGDVAGFFAATYMRGIRFVQVPTTLLAMTDSSVGGKTAVNTSGGKNIAGVFYQPALVWINPSFIATLPSRHIKNGIAEVIKYSLTFDKKFYVYLSDVFAGGFISAEYFNYIIHKSCSYKSAVVEKDEKETKGLREILNFGHTLAHALETYTEYKKFLHGEAVAAGMLFAAKLSYELKFCSSDTYNKIRIILSEAGFLFDFSGMDHVKLVDLMTKDKKSVDGKIRFVLLKDIGKPVCGVTVAAKKIEKILKAFIGEYR